MKVEINRKEHFNVLGLQKIDFSVTNQWYNGSCQVTTYYLDELIGTKLRALYQRRKGRDLFDLYKALNTGNLNCDKVLECYHKYMEFVVDNPPSKKEFLQNMEIKMQDDEFLGDTELLLRSEENFNPQEAYELIKNELIEKM